MMETYDKMRFYEGDAYEISKIRFEALFSWLNSRGLLSDLGRFALKEPVNDDSGVDRDMLTPEGQTLFDKYYKNWLFSEGANDPPTFDLLDKHLSPTRVVKFNHFHEPAGSPIGGQFASKDAGVGDITPNTKQAYNRALTAYSKMTVDKILRDFKEGKNLLEIVDNPLGRFDELTAGWIKTSWSSEGNILEKAIIKCEGLDNSRSRQPDNKPSFSRIEQSTDEWSVNVTKKKLAYVADQEGIEAAYGTFKAACKAIIDKTYSEKGEELHRGILGKSAEEVVSSLINNAKKGRAEDPIPIGEVAVASWTNKLDVAHVFGKDSQFDFGITISTKVERNDILVPPEVIRSGERYGSEKEEQGEFIVKMPNWRIALSPKSISLPSVETIRSRVDITDKEVVALKKAGVTFNESAKNSTVQGKYTIKQIDSTGYSDIVGDVNAYLKDNPPKAGETKMDYAKRVDLKNSRVWCYARDFYEEVVK